MEREIFAQTVLRHKEKLWGYALQLTRNRPEAEDLLQLTYLRAFEHWEQLRELERACTWLVRTMHRAFVDLYRRKLRSPLEPAPAQDDDTGEPLQCLQGVDEGFGEQTEARDALQKTLVDLPPSLAQALTLRDVWGFSYEEIAELMDCPIGTVRSRIARARLQMLERLTASNSPKQPARQTPPLSASAGEKH